MILSNETPGATNSIQRRLTELVARRYELMEELTHARNKLVENSLKREIKAVTRESQRYTSVLMSAGYTTGEISQAVSAGLNKN